MHAAQSQHKAASPLSEPAARIHAIVDRARHLLPDQGPIGVFIHHNTLHAFQHLPFHEAVRRGSQVFQAEPYLPIAVFRQHLLSGRIAEADLDAALEEESAREGLREAAYLGGELTSRAIRRLALRCDITPQSPSALRFALAERELATRLGADVPVKARQRILDEGGAHLRRLFAEGRSDELLRLLLGGDGPRAAAAAMERFGADLAADALPRLLERQPEAAAVSALLEACRRLSALQPPPAPLSAAAPPSLAQLLQAATLEDALGRVHALLIRTLAAYLDEGVAVWPMPHRQAGYLSAMAELFSIEDHVPEFLREPWLAAAGASLRKLIADGTTPAEVVLRGLAALGVAEDEQESYVTRALLALPGWSGMMSRLETRPSDRPPGSPPASLLELLAVRLLCEWHALAELAERRLGHVGPLAGLRQRLHAEAAPQAPDPAAVRDANMAYRLFRLFSLAGIAAPRVLALEPAVAKSLLDELDHFDDLLKRRIFQEAFERTHRRMILDALAEKRRYAWLKARAVPPQAQIIFCFDDREESIRRSLEELGDAYETYGAAGFFGVAMDFVSLDDPRPKPLCPAVTTPAHEVEEHPVAADHHLHLRRQALHRARARLYRELAAASRSAWAGVVLSLGLWVAWLVALVCQVLLPRATGRASAWARRTFVPAPRTELQGHRDGDASPSERGRHRGFTIDEQAQRVALLLENIGLVSGFSPLVILLGHGSSSRNNPHASAYDCGACGGRRGGANARLFAKMANRDAVRERLRARGIDIPDGTIFLGGVHDTTTCGIELFDADRLSDVQRQRLCDLLRALDTARMWSAHERTRRFLTVPKPMDPESALRHVEARAESLAEPRPEYGHATNALAIVGRRSLSRGLFLDRRAFLISYDPALDADGRILERILAAAVPVGAGINLEYYFSCVDNERYGCGTKLAHNVSGLLGVMNGHEGDLLPGLTRQMVEIHEPLRLLCIVEATPETLLSIAGRQPEVAELVKNRWLQLVALDPETGAMHVYTESGFSPYTPAAVELPWAPSSSAYYSGRSEHLPPARIGGPPPQRGAHPAEEDRRAA